jgi:hypothetical protein
MQFWVEEELFQDSDCGQAELLIAESHEEVVLHLLEDVNPFLQVCKADISLSASIEYLDVRPFQTLKVLLLNHFLKGLGYEESVPLLRRAVSAVFFRVRARDIDLFLGTWKGVHLERRGPDVFRAGKQDFEVLLCELGVEVHDLSEVDQTNFQSSLWRLLLENSVNDLEEDWSVVLNCLCVDRLNMLTHFGLSCSPPLHQKSTSLHSIASSTTSNDSLGGGSLGLTVTYDLALTILRSILLVLNVDLQNILSLSRFGNLNSLSRRMWGRSRALSLRSSVSFDVLCVELD